MVYYTVPKQSFITNILRAVIPVTHQCIVIVIQGFIQLGGSFPPKNADQAIFIKLRKGTRMVNTLMDGDTYIVKDKSQNLSSIPLICSSQL